MANRDERARYKYPQARHSGGQTSKSPTPTIAGQTLDAVITDQLNTGLTGQIRYRISGSNLYAYLFGIKEPIGQVIGYFVLCSAIQRDYTFPRIRLAALNLHSIRHALIRRRVS